MLLNSVTAIDLCGKAYERGEVRNDDVPNSSRQAISHSIYNKAKKSDTNTDFDLTKIGMAVPCSREIT